MNRAEHLQWAKDRALAELTREGLPEELRLRNAQASMLSDLNKHPELSQSVMPGFIAGMLAIDEPSCRRWIDGFN